MPAITFNPAEVILYYAARVPGLKPGKAAQRNGPYPVHKGKGPNFKVNTQTGEAFCHSQCRHGWDILGLEQALTGANFKTAKEEVFRLVGRIEPEHQCNGTRTNGNSAGTAPSKPFGTAAGLREVARYPYVDEDANLLSEAVRFLKPDGGKDFKQCKPDGYGGVVWNLDGVKRVPYRLPQVLKAETVSFPRGKGVSTPWKHGGWWRPAMRAGLAAVNYTRDGWTTSRVSKSSYFLTMTHRAGGTRRRWRPLCCLWRLPCE
jgi:hypothetical protein